MFLTTFRNNIDVNVNLRAIGQQQQLISRVLEIEGVSSRNDDIVQQQSTTRKARYEILADFRNFVRSVPMQSATQRVRVRCWPEMRASLTQCARQHSALILIICKPSHQKRHAEAKNTMLKLGTYHHSRCF